MTLLQYGRPSDIVFERTDEVFKPSIKEINEAWTKSQIGARQMVEGFFEVGRALKKMKNQMPHGIWVATFDEGKLPFKLNTAEILMKIAANGVLSKSGCAQILPPSWPTLYELTKIPEDRLEAAIERGVIHPQMQRKDVVALRPQKPRGPKTPIDKPATPHDDLAGELQDSQETLERLEQTNQQLLEQWRDIDSLIARLAQLSLTADNKIKIAGDVLAALRVSAEDLIGARIV